MPDWSYQTIFRPLLFLLPAQTARDITLWTMGSLARLPLGPSIIDWMGHMKPADGLQQTFLKTNLPGPVGLAGELDRDLLGLPALQRFGFGFLEIGPVTLQPLSGEEPVERIVAECAVYDPYPLANLGLLSMLKKLEASPSNGTTRVAKIGHAPLATPRAAAAEQIFLMQALSPFCEWFALDTRFALDTVEWSAAEWEEYFCLLNQLLQDSALSVSLLLSFPADLQEAQMNLLVQLALENGIDGLQISGGIRRQAYGRLYGRSAFLPSLAKVQQLRERYGASLPLIIEGGIHEPEQALSLLAHGADLILLHSGLVYSGPGLPKRINEAILHQEQQSVSSMDATQDVSSRNALPRWWSGVLLGLGMIVAGVFAWLVAVTEVLLPYDEAFLGMTRAGIHQINERLLHFLAHDRISLAGTMISIGILYTALSWFALKRHEHWARQILLISGICGFGNLFYFWGFGYFDPLHALISTSLFPFFLHAVWSRYNAPVPVPLPDLTNDRIWRKGLWGQLCFVIIGCGLLGAGFIISMIGLSVVFVPEDLAFLQTNARTLHDAHPRLLPLIAHDRAGFGGALIADGMVVLFLTLWGFRRGARWIWWSLALAGPPGFVAGIGIHYAVGYVDLWHLFPVFVAVAIFLAGLWCSYPYLHATSRRTNVPPRTAKQVDGM